MNNKKKENKLSSNETSKELKKQLKSLLLSKNFETSEGMGTGGSGTGGGDFFGSYYGECRMSGNFSLDGFTWTGSGTANCYTTLNHDYTMSFISATFSITFSGNETTQSDPKYGEITINGNMIIEHAYSTSQEPKATIHNVSFSVTKTAKIIDEDGTEKTTEISSSSVTRDINVSCIINGYDGWNHTLELNNGTISVMDY